MQTLSDVCLKRTYSHDASAFSALEVLNDNRALIIYLLYLLVTFTLVCVEMRSTSIAHRVCLNEYVDWSVDAAGAGYRHESSHGPRGTSQDDGRNTQDLRQL